MGRCGPDGRQVREEARQLDPVKAVLTILLVLPFVVGWVAGTLVRAVWAVLAVKFRTAQGREDEPG